MRKEHDCEVMAVCEHRLLHLPLHDFVERDHCPPFDGTIRWGEILLALDDIGYEGELMFEAGAFVPLEDTLRKTAAFPDEFAARFGG